MEGPRSKGSGWETLSPGWGEQENLSVLKFRGEEGGDCEERQSGSVKVKIGKGWRKGLWCRGGFFTVLILVDPRRPFGHLYSSMFYTTSLGLEVPMTPGC